MEHQQFIFDPAKVRKEPEELERLLSVLHDASGRYEMFHVMFRVKPFLAPKAAA